MSSNAALAISQAFANAMKEPIEIKTDLEVSVMLHNLSNQVAELKIELDTVKKVSAHNSNTNIELQKVITLGKIEEAKKKIKLSGI